MNTFRFLVLGLATTTTIAAPGARAQVACADLAAAPLAAPADPSAARAFEVWDRLASVAGSLTGLTAELRVLAPGARKRDGQPFPPNAVTCPERGQVVIYLTDTLLELVLGRERYPVDFLAFVLGHELGHRINDLDPAGKPLVPPRGPVAAAFTGGGLPADREILADLRGAYFAATAGYSVRRLTCDDCLNHYLKAEARLAPETRLARKAALAGVLRDFEAWETVYQAAAALAFWGHGDEARRLLAWADAETRRLAVPIPELDVLHALVLTMKAAEHAPWLAETRVPAAALAHLRCTPIYPAHSALSERLDAGAPEGGTRGAAETEAARRDLLQARRLLKDAETMGAGGLVVATAQACVSLYLGQTKEAARELARARKLAGKTPPPALVEALAHDEALLALVGLVIGAPIAPGDQAGWRTFTRSMTAAKGALDASPAIAALVKALDKAGPGVVPPAPGPSARASCPAPDDRGRAAPRLPDLPRAPAGGGCPCGWVGSGELRGERASPDAPPVVTLCVPAGWGQGQRWLDLRLPANSTEPEPLALGMLMIDGVEPGLAALGRWERACEALQHRGTSDAGDAMLATQCPALGLPNGLLVTGDACRVDRAIILDLE
ncbi:MAG: hypothetical protein IT385_15980 [Deltaproteobacteria bacterium]|nr:hypothetical protein [Deltaproteobacteria bacterium]